MKNKLPRIKIGFQQYKNGNIMVTGDVTGATVEDVIAFMARGVIASLKNLEENNTIEYDLKDLFIVCFDQYRKGELMNGNTVQGTSDDVIKPSEVVVESADGSTTINAESKEAE